MIWLEVLWKSYICKNKSEGVGALLRIDVQLMDLLLMKCAHVWQVDELINKTLSDQSKVWVSPPTWDIVTSSCSVQSPDAASSVSGVIPPLTLTSI